MTNNLQEDLLKSLDVELLGKDKVQIEQKDESLYSLSWQLLKSAGPTLFQFVSVNITASSLLYFISKRNPHLMGSVGLALTIYFITIISLMVALNIGLCTLGAQAFGTKKYRLIGLYYKKAQLIGLVVLVPVGVLLMKIAPLLMGLRFNEELSYNIQKG